MSVLGRFVMQSFRRCVSHSKSLHKEEYTGHQRTARDDATRSYSWKYLSNNVLWMAWCTLLDCTGHRVYSSARTRQPHESRKTGARQQQPDGPASRELPDPWVNELRLVRQRGPVRTRHGRVPGVAERHPVPPGGTVLLCGRMRRRPLTPSDKARPKDWRREGRCARRYLRPSLPAPSAARCGPDGAGRARRRARRSWPAGSRRRPGARTRAGTEAS